jgi:hypothetical protein
VAIGDFHFRLSLSKVGALHPDWLRTMWEDGESACADMIEILISLALLKLKSRL